MPVSLYISEPRGLNHTICVVPADFNRVGLSACVFAWCVRRSDGDPDPDLISIRIWSPDETHMYIRSVRLSHSYLAYHQHVKQSKSQARRCLLTLTVEDLESVGRRPETLILTRLRLLER